MAWQAETRTPNLVCSAGRFVQSQPSPPRPPGLNSADRMRRASQLIPNLRKVRPRRKRPLANRSAVFSVVALHLGRSCFRFDLRPESVASPRLSPQRRRESVGARIPFQRWRNFMPRKAVPPPRHPPRMAATSSLFRFVRPSLSKYDGTSKYEATMPAAQTAGGFGSGTSPIIVGNKVIFNRDQQANSAIMAFDLETGKKLWETARAGSPTSYSTPVVWQEDNRTNVLWPAPST